MLANCMMLLEPLAPQIPIAQLIGPSDGNGFCIKLPKLKCLKRQ